MEKISVKTNTSSKSLVESVISQAKKPNFIWIERTVKTHPQPSEIAANKPLTEGQIPINLDEQR